MNVTNYSVSSTPEKVSLRKKAEKSLKKKKSAKPFSAAETLKILHELEDHQEMMLKVHEAEMSLMNTKLNLVHELEVHHVELEMQNEELMVVRTQLEESLKRHLFLYDFAPTVYFSVDKSGLIIEMNRSGARLLGKERSVLINTNLIYFISTESRHVFKDFLQKAFETGYPQTCKVRMISTGNDLVNVHFHAIFYEVEQIYFLSGIDVLNFRI